MASPRHRSVHKSLAGAGFIPPNAPRLLAFAALALAAILSSPLAAAQSAWQDIWNSESAARQVSVEGELRTRAIVGKREHSATALVRAAGGKLRLDYQAGDRHWSLIDDGSRLIHLYPHRQSAVALPRPSLATDSALAERNYTARTVGEVEVAGRPTQLVEVSPRPSGPAAWRLWLDRETGFALKRERYNTDGQLISGTEYTSVRFGVSIPPDVFGIPQNWRLVDKDGGARRYSMSELGRQVGFDVVAPRYLPQGFVLQGGYVESHGRRAQTVAELRYTDGLRLLSISQRVRGKGDRPGGGRGHGPRYRGGRGGGGGGHGRGGRGGEGGRGFGFGRPSGEAMTLVDRGSEKALRYFGGNRVIVVVGDLPRDELVRIATSFD